MIIVTVSKYDIPSISKGSPRKYLDWSELGAPEFFEELDNFCAICPLGDAPLPITPLLSGLANYLRLLSSSGDDGELDIGGCGAVASAVAKSFAMAFRTSDEASKLSTCRVGPLPAALFSAASLAEQTLNSPVSLVLAFHTFFHSSEVVTRFKYEADYS